MARVWIPSLLRDSTGGAEQVVAVGKTLRQVISSLEMSYPGIRERLVDQTRDALHPAFAAAIDGNTNHLGLLQPVDEDSEIVFVPAVSGGSAARAEWWGMPLSTDRPCPELTASYESLSLEAFVGGQGENRAGYDGRDSSAPT